MIVDDSPSVRLFFERSLEGFDLNLVSCESAEQALERLVDTTPALVFLDIIMPDKDGLTFLQEMRRLPGHAETPVIVVSSKDYAQDKMTAKQLGAREFVIKPMSTRTIQDIVTQYTACGAPT